MTEYSVNIAVTAADAASATIAKVRKHLAAVVAPVKGLQARFKKMGQDTGLTKVVTTVKNLQAPLKKARDEAGKLVKTLGLMGGGLLGGAIAGFKALFLNTAVGNEQLARSMENVMGSGAAAQAALAGIQASMKGFDHGDATEAFMRMRAAGLSTQQEDLTRLADVAGHTGKSLTEVADAFASLHEGQTQGVAEILGGNVKQVNGYLVAEFADSAGKVRRMAIKEGTTAAQKAKAVQKLFRTAADAKGMQGGAERFGQSWQGMVQRAQSAWHTFVTLVMDSGPFALLKKKFADILASFDALEASGGLQAVAEEWAQAFLDAINGLWEGGKALVSWFKSDFLPAFTAVKEFLGGWGGVVKAVGVLLAGPFLLSLFSAAQGVLALAAAMVGPLAGAFGVAGKAAIFFSKGMPVTSGSSWLAIITKSVLLLAKALAVSLVKGLGHAAKGFLLLGKAILFTPVGWIVAAVAVIAGLAYLIYKHWDKVSAFFKKLWAAVTKIFSAAWEALYGYLMGKIQSIVAAFDKGFLQGMLEIFLAFSPVVWIADAVNALVNYLFGIDLKAAGGKMVDGILTGLKQKWTDLKAWLVGAWADLTDWLPDVVKDKIGITAAAPSPAAQASAGAGSGAGSGAGGMMASHRPPRSTGAAAAMAGGAAAPKVKLPEQKVTTEVIIKGENMPQGMTVSTPKSGADKTRVDCGYMMGGTA